MKCYYDSFQYIAHFGIFICVTDKVMLLCERVAHARKFMHVSMYYVCVCAYA